MRVRCFSWLTQDASILASFCFFSPGVSGSWAQSARYLPSKLMEKPATSMVCGSCFALEGFLSSFFSLDSGAGGGLMASLSFETSTGGRILKSYGEASPPRRSRRNSWVWSPRLARKKMAELSGAHCALCSPRLSAGGEKVSWRGLSALVAEAGTIQRWLAAPSAVAWVRVKSTCLPSGERIGEESAFRWRRSSLVGKCKVVAEGAGVGPDCAAAWSQIPAETKQTRGRTSVLNRSMASEYNGEEKVSGLSSASRSWRS